MSKKRRDPGFGERLAVLENEVKHCNLEISSVKTKLGTIDSKLDRIAEKVGSKLGAREWGAIITTVILAVSAIVTALLK